MDKDSKAEKADEKTSKLMTEIHTKIMCALEGYDSILILNTLVNIIIRASNYNKKDAILRSISHGFDLFNKLNKDNINE